LREIQGNGRRQNGGGMDLAAIKEWFGLYNVIFNWFEKNHGEKGFMAYAAHIANTCYPEVIEDFKRGGLEAVKAYYEDLFHKDDGQIDSYIVDDVLTISVNKCPAYNFMKNSPNPHFIPTQKVCRFDEIVNGTLAAKSGMVFEQKYTGHNGKCIWEFKKTN